MGLVTEVSLLRPQVGLMVYLGMQLNAMLLYTIDHPFHCLLSNVSQVILMPYFICKIEKGLYQRLMRTACSVHVFSDLFMDLRILIQGFDHI